MIDHASTRCAAFTIIAKNYLALAKTLAGTLRQFHPDIDFHLLVVDMAGLPVSEIDLKTISLIDPLMMMEAAQYNRMAVEYDITEFSTSLKPFALRHLLDQGYGKVLYFDPDILIMRRIDEILDSLESANIVLTPHLLDPIPLDDLLPNEAAMLKAGAYNLGFIGVRGAKETGRFLDWWADRLSKYCRIAFSQGLFVDQKWIDLVPGLFDGVLILKNQGCNVAYWNIHSRRLSVENGQYYVGERRLPLIFYHFSGYNTERPEVFSKHQNRTDLASDSVLRDLFLDYTQRLETNGHMRYRALPYNPGVLPGVNVAGYLTAELGVGEAARGYVSSIKQLNMGVTLTDFSQGTSSRKSDTSLSGFTKDNSFPVNLICVNADQVGNFISHAGHEYIEGKTNIGVWWWELPKFPEMWLNRFKYFEQIWVGSEFARIAVQAATHIPVIKIPPVVEVKLGQTYSREHYGLIPSEFVFLFVFDFFSIFERKNPLAIVREFKQAFKDNEPVRLVLKCINESHDPGNLKRIEQEIGNARITIMKGYFTKDEKNGLISVADCYVSLHRAEGFGYTLAEAMYLGKPVIATAWSGNMDFMTNENSYPVDYKLVELEADFGPYERGQTWAEPSIEHAATLMRRIYDNPDEAGERGRMASLFIRRNHSPQAVANSIRNYLYVLPVKPVSQKRPGHRALMMHFFGSHKVRRLMAAVNRRLPPRVGMRVKSALAKAGWY